MPVYRLQATMRFTDERDGFAIDEIDIEAANIEMSIILAREWQPARPDLTSDALMLIGPEGTVVWSLRRMAQS